MGDGFGWRGWQWGCRRLPPRRFPPAFSPAAVSPRGASPRFFIKAAYSPAALSPVFYKSGVSPSAVSPAVDSFVLGFLVVFGVGTSSFLRVLAFFVIHGASFFRFGAPVSPPAYGASFTHSYRGSGYLRMRQQAGAASMGRDT